MSKTAAKREQKRLEKELGLLRLKQETEGFDQARFDCEKYLFEDICRLEKIINPNPRPEIDSLIR